MGGWGRIHLALVVPLIRCCAKPDCWHPCGSKGGNCSWCGEEAACCKAGFLDDPAECRGVFVNFSTSHHECVSLVGTEVRTSNVNQAFSQPGRTSIIQDCWHPCNASGGLCDFCGAGKACCKKGFPKDPPVCKEAKGFFTTYHECVTIQEKSLLAPAPVEHVGEDCWGLCGHAGYCDRCGRGNACCKRGSPIDPPECKQATGFLTCHHECVATAENVAPRARAHLEHAGQDCWIHCGQGGYCDWCGAGNACCKRGLAKDPAECRGAISNLTKHHECVVITDRVDSICGSPDCWQPCGSKGGYCDWCGAGLACCKEGSLQDAAECKRANGFVTSHHECVVVREETREETTPTPLQNVGKDCWVHCGLRGGNCSWCGIGNACCRKDFNGDPVECRKAVNFKTSHHECVQLIDDSPDAQCTVDSAQCIVDRAGQDCWESCGRRGGYCSWCGNGKACCKRDFSLDPDECRGVRNYSTFHHECVTPAATSVTSFVTTSSMPISLLLFINGTETKGRADLRAHWSVLVIKLKFKKRTRYVLIAKIQQDAPRVVAKNIPPINQPHELEEDESVVVETILPFTEQTTEQPDDHTQ